MIPLRPRIIGALELAPMTASDVIRALSANRNTVRSYLAELVETGEIRRIGVRKAENGRPGRVYVANNRALIARNMPRTPQNALYGDSMANPLRRYSPASDGPQIALQEVGK